MLRQLASSPLLWQHAGRAMSQGFLGSAGAACCAEGAPTSLLQILQRGLASGSSSSRGAGAGGAAEKAGLTFQERKRKALGLPPEAGQPQPQQQLQPGQESTAVTVVQPHEGKASLQQVRLHAGFPCTLA